MRYEEFRDAVRDTRRRAPQGLTWRELRDAARLPYTRPCPTWTGP